MNKVVLSGRWARKPELMENTSSPVLKGTLAVDRRFKKDGEQTADFISVVAFGKTAEHIAKYYDKGMKTEIAGRIQTGNYEKDGVKHYTTDVVIEEVGFAESKKEAASGEVVQNGFIENNGFVQDSGEAQEVFNF